MSNHATSSSRILICNSKELTETSYKVIDFIRYCDHNKFKNEDESTVLLYVFVLLIFCILMSGFVIMVSIIIGQCQSGRNSDIEASEFEAKINEIDEISLKSEMHHCNICFVSNV